MSGEDTYHYCACAVSYFLRVATPVVLRCTCGRDGAQRDVEYGLCYLVFIVSKGVQ